MTEQTTRTDYAERIERVIIWLTEHLDEALDLTRLADVACMSPYHFHRIYHGMQKETVADTVRRLRLHRAAVELIAWTLPVERIARRAGYTSQEAFTRAFKAAYSVPPARYRSLFVPIPGMPEKESTMETATCPVTTREIAPIRVAALHHAGDYQQIGPTFERLAALGAAQGLMGPHTRMLGIFYDDPAATPVDALRSDACISVPSDWTATGELQKLEIRGGRYAVALHVGPYAELSRAYMWLLGTWLPQSGEEGADAPCIEEYMNDPRTLPPTEWRTEVWLPLR